MVRKNSVSSQTRNNWLIDFSLFVGAVIASLTGVYFLFLPTGGYQGGRNPTYGIRFIFDRHTWDDLHTWGGILMIVAAVIHIIIHWSWIKSMTRRILRDIFSKETKLNNRSRTNSGINAMIAMSFFVTTLTAVYLLFIPGGKQGITDPMFLFSRTTWDLIHTWSGIIMMISAVIHLAIHWKWVTKVTSKIYISLTNRESRNYHAKELTADTTK